MARLEEVVVIDFRTAKMRGHQQKTSNVIAGSLPPNSPTLSRAATKIGNELRNKRPEHFVDKSDAGRNSRRP